MYNNNISPVSFKCQLFITEYLNGKDNYVIHPISDEQFQEIKSLVSFVPKNEETKVSYENLNFIYNYLKNLGIKSTIDKLKTSKCIYYSDEQVRIYDKNAQIVDGCTLDFQA